MFLLSWWQRLRHWPLSGVGAWGSWGQLEACSGVCQRGLSVQSVAASLLHCDSFAGLHPCECHVYYHSDSKGGAAEYNTNKYKGQWFFFFLQWYLQWQKSCTYLEFRRWSKILSSRSRGCIYRRSPCCFFHSLNVHKLILKKRWQSRPTETCLCFNVKIWWSTDNFPSRKPIYLSTYVFIPVYAAVWGLRAQVLGGGVLVRVLADIGFIPFTWGSLIVTCSSRLDWSAT